MKTTPGARARAGVALLALALFAAASAEAGIRYRAVRFVPQGEVVADGYDLHIRSPGDTAWAVIDMGFVETNDNGIARYRVLLNDDVDYELAVSAYVLDGSTKLSSPLSNQIEVEAIATAACTVDADCADGDVCNGEERCLAGACYAGEALTCADPGPCEAAICHAVDGCQVVPDLDDPACNPGPAPECVVDADCSDDNVCNGAETCSAGVCQGGATLACQDPGPCQAAVCDALAGCLVVEDPDDPTCECLADADCADGDVCNGTEQCAGGVCLAGTSLTCQDPGPCEAAICHAVNGCQIVPDPDDPACAPEPECVFDADCTDGDVCNGAEVCVGGACWAGEDLACGDPGPCRVALCDPQDGCVVVEDPDDPSCPETELDHVSIDLDGNGESLGTTGPAVLGIGTEFTLSMWVKPAALDGEDQSFLFTAYAPGADPSRSKFSLAVLNHLAGDPYRVVIHDDSGDQMQTREFDGGQRVGVWQHVVMTQQADGRHAELFVDGVEIPPSRVSRDRSGSMADRPREIVIGAHLTRLRRFYEGAIGHVALWDRQLTPDEIAEIHAGRHDIDLRQDQGAYGSSARLRHYWRPGEDLDRLGADFVASEPVHLDELVGLDESDVIDDAP